MGAGEAVSKSSFFLICCWNFKYAEQVSGKDRWLAVRAAGAGAQENGLKLLSVLTASDLGDVCVP